MAGLKKLVSDVKATGRNVCPHLSISYQNQLNGLTEKAECLVEASGELWMQEKLNVKMF